MTKNSKTALIKPIHGNSTFILILPKEFAIELKINKEDYVKCHIEADCVVIEKTGEQKK